LKKKEKKSPLVDVQATSKDQSWIHPGMVRETGTRVPRQCSSAAGRTRAALLVPARAQFMAGGEEQMIRGGLYLHDEK